MAANHDLVDSIAEGTGMTHEKAARIAEAFAEQSVERHELELTENRLSCAIENFSTQLAAGLAVMRADLNAGLTGLKADLTRLENGLKADLTRLENGLKADVTRLENGQDKLRTELKSDVAQLRAKAKGRFGQQTVNVTYLLAASAALVAAIAIIQNLFFS